MAEDESTIDLEEIIRIMFSNGSVTGQQIYIFNTKSGATYDFTNYRPISLLSSFSKLLENLVSRQMFRFIDKYLIFSPIWI